MGSPGHLPLFSHLRIFLLAVNVIITFFVDRLLKICVTNGLLLPTVGDTGITSIFFCNDDGNAIIDISVVVNNMLLITLVIVLVQLGNNG